MDNVRIRTNINKDAMLHIQMKQNIDMYEILSLNLSMNDSYKLQNSDNGILIGRVLANDAFGIPNAKVSIFIKITDEDKLDNVLSAYYPYSTTSDTNSDSIRYNLLPSSSNDSCYQTVGTFPSKRLILDNDTMVEIYDKYYKFTAVTNKSGDYMIYGIPAGSATIHVDIDLSDIGILSQKPRDFIGKGYNLNQFESPTKFKSGTNLDNLAQIYSQDETVMIYPFWGDENSNEIAISRKDISIQYKFESSCVFMGSIITDSNSSISHDCSIDTKAGLASQLTTGEGTIEIIRKNTNGTIEELSVQGNKVIDSNGVWCYQIPMNLDYIGMDEFGNVVQTNNPDKGIATRARVRFRIQFSDSGGDTSSNHKAIFLVPNNPTIDTVNNHPSLGTTNIDQYYNFGSSTPDECFRDLMWNNIYSVKSFIPRVQKRYNHLNTTGFIGIKGVNRSDASSNNLFPYNKISCKRSWTYFWFYHDRNYQEFFNYDDSSTDEKLDEIANRGSSKYKNQSLANFIEETNAATLDFYNDWINGCIYFPMWHWRARRKKSYSESSSSYDLTFCSSEKSFKLFAVTSCESKKYAISNSMPYIAQDDMFNASTYDSFEITNGLITKKSNKDGLDMFYYVNGFEHKSTSDSDPERFIRLFATDIILLGNLNEDNIFGIPQFYDGFPNTTCQIPPMIPDTSGVCDTTSFIWGFNDNYKNGLFIGPPSKPDNMEDKDSLTTQQRDLYWKYYNNCKNSLSLMTIPISCINAERACELGVALDMNSNDTNVGTDVKLIGKADGLITRREIEDSYGRQVFASLNSVPLVVSSSNINSYTNYAEYPLIYLCPVDFDGALSNIIGAYTNNYSQDYPSTDYLYFRYGQYNDPSFYNTDDYKSYSFRSMNNSYYFYFGLNAGNTAIEQLRLNYISSCSSASEKAFTVNIDTVNPTYTNIQGGSITATAYLSTNCQIALEDSDKNILSTIDISYSASNYPIVYTFSDLAAGTYYVNVISLDSEGNSIEEVLTKTKLSVTKLNFELTAYDEYVLISDISMYGVLVSKLSNLANFNENMADFSAVTYNSDSSENNYILRVKIRKNNAAMDKLDLSSEILSIENLSLKLLCSKAQSYIIEIVELEYKDGSYNELENSRTKWSNE